MLGDNDSSDQVRFRSLLHAFAVWARRHPNKTWMASVVQKTEIGFGEAHRVAVALSSLLRTETDPSARIVVVSRDHWLYLPLIAACAATGRTLVPVGPDLRPSEFKAIFETCEPELVIFDDHQAVKAAFEHRRVRTITQLLAVTSNAPQPPEEGAAEDEAGMAPDRPLLIIHTSGSTGSGKAVMLTAKNLMSMADRLRQRFAISSDDRFLSVLPYYHMNATMITGCVPLLAGASVVVTNFVLEANYWECARRHQITICSLIPPLLSTILKLGKESDRTPESVRFCFCGTAPLPAQLWSTFEKRYKVPVFQGYGLTETTCWATSTVPGEHQTYASVGKPFPDCVIRIDARALTAKELSWERELQADAADTASDGPVVGEILIGGPIVLKGYFGQPKATEEPLAEGLFRTGDVGFFDGDGNLQVSGRIKEMIIRNGINITPEDVDSIIRATPQVQDCKTIGVPSEITGESVVSVVVARPSERLTLNSILTSSLREHVSQTKRPDRLFFMGYIPRTPVGKLALADIKAVVTGTAVVDLCARITEASHRAPPSDPQRIQALVKAAVIEGTALSFVQYWGLGTHREPGAADIEAFDRITGFLKEASFKHHVRAGLTLILTDVHAKLSDKNEARSDAYFAAIIAEAAERGFAVTRLSAIWSSHGIELQHLFEQGRRLGWDEAWSGCAEVAPETRERFVHAAKKRAEGATEPDLAAKVYLLACRWERGKVAATFPEAIFVSYHQPDHDFCIPPLPRVYMRSGDTIRPRDEPWLVD
jgi:long-chain acyl-CoA synthetase